MLAPNERQLYVDALKPPIGYVLGQAVATTYSLELDMLLAVPVALALPHLDLQRLRDQSAIALLQAVREVSAKLTVFCDRGGVAAPSACHVLYGLLEPTLFEVAVPHGGALHAKLWLLRFDPESDDRTGTRMRLVVLSRNLTFDRCWDVCVSLDGTLSGRAKRDNQPLADMLNLLVERTLQPLPAARREALSAFTEEVRRTLWELPDGFSELQFHLLGAGKRPRSWLPGESDRLVVISPFVRDAALRELTDTTREAVALIARGEELDRLDRETLRRFESVYTLHEATEREDGEDDPDGVRRPGLRGLHAKVFAAKRGWYTSVCLGSANATDAALLAGQNVELMVELIGKTTSVPGRGIEGMFDKEGLSELLQSYDPSLPQVFDDPAQVRADAQLRELAQALAEAPLRMAFTRDGALYRVQLAVEQALAATPPADCSAWLVTVDSSSAVEAHALFETRALELLPCSPESATSLVAFRLMVPEASAPVTFVRNVPTTSLPSERDAQVLRRVIHNRERFYLYLLSLLEGFTEGVLGGEHENAEGSGAARGRPPVALLERLIRTRARDPERLEELRSVVDALRATPEGTEILAADFMAVWRVLEEVPA